MVDRSYHLIKNVVLLSGADHPGVGKTWLRLRMVDGDNKCLSELEVEPPTVGVDHGVLVRIVLGQRIACHVWDVGARRFSTTTSYYFRGAHCLAACFSVGDRESLLGLSAELRAAISQRGDRPACVVVGLQGDLPQCDRAVTEEDVRRVCDEFQAPYVETSARHNRGIEDLLDVVGQLMLARDSQTLSMVPDFGICGCELLPCRADSVRQLAPDRRRECSIT
jgi:GTPase SAR1 family protein